MRPKREAIRSGEYVYFVSTQTVDRKPFFRHERWAGLMIATLAHYGQAEIDVQTQARNLKAEAHSLQAEASSLQAEIRNLPAEARNLQSEGRKLQTSGDVEDSSDSAGGLDSREIRQYNEKLKETVQAHATQK